ncbi:MAG: hypothetical protein WDZ63_18260 [Burkholderiales bacterium]
MLYTLPVAEHRPWDPTGQLTLGLSPASTVTGLLAWGLLAVLVLAAICRNSFPWRYETWRLAHGVGAAVIAGASLHHVLDAGRYSGLPAVQLFWWIAFAVALGSLLLVYVVRPLTQKACPFRVASVTRVAAKTWEIVLEAAGPKRFRYRAGQFAWLKIGSPRPLYENPFSFSSSPAEGDQLRFLIKEAGDFTGGIGAVARGTAAYLDGPHGHMTIPDRHSGAIVLIAGGIGIAPMLSLLRELGARKDPRPVTLIYGNRNREQIVPVETLADTARLRNFTCHYVLSEPPEGWAGITGHLDRRTLEQCLRTDERRNSRYYLCGSVPMIDSVERALEELGVPLGQIVAEKFQYDFGQRSRRTRRVIGIWTALSTAIVLGAVAFALR